MHFHYQDDFPDTKIKPYFYHQTWLNDLCIISMLHYAQKIIGLMLVGQNFILFGRSLSPTFVQCGLLLTFVLCVSRIMMLFRRLLNLPEEEKSK